MSSPAAIPAEAHVRHVLNQYLRDCHDNGTRPSVLAVAAKFDRTLTDNLRFAAAQIQRLAVDNARLREALETSTNVTHIDHPGRRRRR